MAIPEVVGQINELQPGQHILLSQLFTDISVDVTNFDVQIETTNGGYLIDPNGNIYTNSNGIISAQNINELSSWYFVASTLPGLDLIGFDANDASTFNSSTSSNVKSAVLTGNTLIQGIDTKLVINSSNAIAIKNAGYDFVVRYYCADGSEQLLSSSEIANLTAANLQIATVWENKFDQQNLGVQAFAGTAGTTDAQNAIAQAASAGQAAGSAIYFALDVSASSNLSIIENYFSEIRVVFNSETNSATHYKVGIYAFDPSAYTDPLILQNIDLIWFGFHMRRLQLTGLWTRLKRLITLHRPKVP